MRLDHALQAKQAALVPSHAPTLNRIYTDALIFQNFIYRYYRASASTSADQTAIPVVLNQQLWKGQQLQGRTAWIRNMSPMCETVFVGEYELRNLYPSIEYLSEAPPNDSELSN